MSVTDRMGFSEREYSYMMKIEDRSQGNCMNDERCEAIE